MFRKTQLKLVNMKIIKDDKLNEVNVLLTFMILK
jgi:hypothetical protein